MAAHDGSPRYSDAALAVRDLFSEGVIDSYVYVEDEDQENLYELVVKRMIPKLGSFKVFPLGGKSKVISHARSMAGAAGRRMFLVDKDFDDLLGVVESHPGLYYLDDYSIESVLIEEAGIVELVVEEVPKRKRLVIAGRVGFKETMRHWLPLLDSLHRAFFLAQKYSLSIKNCDLAPEYFCVRGCPSRLCDKQVGAYINNIAKLLVDAGVIGEQRHYQELSRRAFSNGRVCFRHINGKFLQRLWYHRLKAGGLISNMTQESMAFRLAKQGSLRRLRGLRKRIMKEQLLGP